MLDGQGADEIHCGYSGFQSAHYKTYFNQRHYHLIFFTYFSRLLSQPSKIIPNTLYLVRSFFPPALLSLSRVIPSVFSLSCFNIRSFLPSLIQLFLKLRNHYIKSFEQKYFLSHTLLQYQVSLGLPSLLRYSDHNSMRFSIESQYFKRCASNFF